jgi:hypothetical protein
MSIQDLTLSDLFVNISNAFVGSLADMYNGGGDVDVKRGKTKNVNENGSDATLRVLIKENRYMYLALLFLVLMLVGNVFFNIES